VAEYELVMPPCFPTDWSERGGFEEVDEVMRNRRWITWGVRISVVAVGVAPWPVLAQPAADSAAVLRTMVHHWLTPENAAHYLGAPPWKLYDPRGETRSVCLVFGKGGGSDLPALENPIVVDAVRDRISDAFGLEYVDRCVLRPEGQGRTRGFFDRNGSLAIQVQLRAVFPAASRASAHFGVSPGVWPGYFGWDCPLEREEDGSWRLIVASCRYFES
jgi:hypothetical protein